MHFECHICCIPTSLYQNKIIISIIHLNQPSFSLLKTVIFRCDEHLSLCEGMEKQFVRILLTKIIPLSAAFRKASAKLQ